MIIKPNSEKSTKRECMIKTSASYVFKWCKRKMQIALASLRKINSNRNGTRWLQKKPLIMQIKSKITRGTGAWSSNLTTRVSKFRGKLRSRVKSWLTKLITTSWSRKKSGILSVNKTASDNVRNKYRKHIRKFGLIRSPYNACTKSSTLSDKQLTI